MPSFIYLIDKKIEVQRDWIICAGEIVQWVSSLHSVRTWVRIHSILTHLYPLSTTGRVRGFLKHAGYLKNWCVQVRHVASVYKMESDQGRHPLSSGFSIHAHSQPHTQDIHVPIHMNMYIHIPPYKHWIMHNNIFIVIFFPECSANFSLPLEGLWTIWVKLLVMCIFKNDRDKSYDNFVLIGRICHNRSILSEWLWMCTVSLW